MREYNTQTLKFDARRCKACCLFCKLLYIELFSYGQKNLYPGLSESERESINIPPPPVLMVEGEKMQETIDEWDMTEFPMERLKMM